MCIIIIYYFWDCLFHRIYFSFLVLLFWFIYILGIFLFDRIQFSAASPAVPRRPRLPASNPSQAPPPPHRLPRPPLATTIPHPPPPPTTSPLPPLTGPEADFPESTHHPKFQMDRSKPPPLTASHLQPPPPATKVPLDFQIVFHIVGFLFRRPQCYSQRWIFFADQ